MRHPVGVKSIYFRALCFAFRVFCCVLARACLGKSSCIYTGKEIEKKSPKLKKREKESGVSRVHLIVGQIRGAPFLPQSCRRLKGILHLRKRQVLKGFPYVCPEPVLVN